MALANQLGISNKVVSENHHYASQSKLTAGEGAKKLSKLLDVKVGAKEIVSAYTLMHGRNPEWHHSGLFKNGMGKTYFFTDAQIDDLAHNWYKVSQLKEEEEVEQLKLIEEGKIIVKGWYVNFKHEKINQWGKMAYKPYLGVFEGAKANIPPNFSPLSDGEYLSAKLQDGRRLEAYEKCIFKSISKIAYNRIIKSRETERLALLDNKQKTDNKIQAEKDTKEAITLKNIDHFNSLDLNSLSDEELLKEWAKANFFHPVPSRIFKLKEASGLTWNFFKLNL